ncbi:MAG: competence/damage-inducible protein A [Acidimicrobiia bacterium]
MIVEVVAVGTELLLGQIVNTNAARIGEDLASSGFDAHFQTVVGDNRERLVAALRQAVERSDSVIITGGLGPTPDDLTREALSDLAGVPMDFDDDYADELRRRFSSIGRRMPSNNLRQAEYPRGASRLPNPKGTAPGLSMMVDDTLVFAVPGVPAEMDQMLAEYVLPKLWDFRGESEALVSRLLRTWGASESAVSEMLDDLYQRSANPSVAYLASAGEIKVRLTAQAGTPEAAAELLAPLEHEVRERLGSSVFALDDETVEEVVLRECKARGWTLGTVESATAGLVAARLTQVPGASEVFKGSVIAYSADLKESLVGVSSDVIARFGVVSEEVAREMAEGAAKALEADVVLAVTGSAGPDELEQPAGTMVFAVGTPEDLRSRTIRLPGDRERVRTYGATAGIHLVRLAVQGLWW